MPLFWKRKKDEYITLGLNREATPEEQAIASQPIEEEIPFFEKFRNAVAATRENLSDRIESVIAGKREIDRDVLDHLEEALIGADLGIQTTSEIIDKVRQKVHQNQLADSHELKKVIKSELLEILESAGRNRRKGTIASETEVSLEIKPYVMMIVGVNGVGKTTTIGKLAHRIKSEGNEVMICAADTFRAAANDQLAIWAERSGVPLIQHKPGTDPSAVLFDALKAGKS